MAQGGWATASTTAGDVGAPALGLRAAYGLHTAFDVDFSSSYSRHTIPATDKVPSLALDLTNLGVGISYHLDELVVLPYLAAGPSVIIQHSPSRTLYDPAIRIAVGVDWDFYNPWILGVAAQYQYLPENFPESSILVLVLGIGVHFHAPASAR